MKKIRNGNGLLAALDIGTTKMVCFIAKVDVTGDREVVGIGHQVSQGVHAGMITDIRAAERCILSTVSAAEQMAGENIDRVIVNMAGNKLSSQIVHTEVQMGGNEITERDIARLMDAAMQQCVAEDRTIIHCTPLDYILDGETGIKDPCGMYGKHLKSRFHVVSVSSTALLNLTNCLARCHLDVADLVVPAYVSSLACLTQDEMELGVTVLDIGGGTTSVAVFKEGHVIAVDSIPLGGVHITRDMAQGLSTDLANAERIKTLYGNVMVTSSDEREIIDVPNASGDENDMHYVPRAMLVKIIRPRVEEILEMAKQRLSQKGLDALSGSRLVITGGTSQLQGMKELASHIFGKQVRIATPEFIEGLAESTKGPAFATSIGMLQYAARQNSLDRFISQKVEPSNVKHYYQSFAKWLRENF